MKDLYYVCSPLRGETKFEEKTNSSRAEVYERMAEVRYDCRAIAPHSFLPKYLDDSVSEERQLALKIGLELLSVCKKLVIFGDKITEGMAREIAFANANGIEVINYEEDEEND
jgi:hypothetical protein